MKRNLLFVLVALLSLVASADEYTDPQTNVIYTYNPASNRAEVKSGTWLMFDNGEASLPTPGSPDAKDEIGILDRFSVEGKEYVVDKIGDYAFSTLDIKSVVIPSSVKSIGMDAFSGCVSLSDLFLSEGLISIEDNAFCGCHSLTYLLLPEGLETIGFESFTLCSKLKSVSIPSSVTNIDVYAFLYCSSLTDVYCYAENIPITESNVFYECPIASATLHVPAGFLEKYKVTAPWSEFGNIVAMPEEPSRPLPFLEGNPIWVFKDEQMPLGRVNDEACWIDAGLRAYTYYFLGEKKEIEGKVYTMMGEVRINGEWGMNLIRWLPVREEDGVVYALTSYLPGVVDNFYNAYGNTIPYPQQENECVLYNFRDVLYPQDESSAGKSFSTYQLMDGTTCRAQGSNWQIADGHVEIYIYDLCEKLGYLNILSCFGVMDPLHGFTMTTSTHDVFMWSLNAYYQDDTMLYKAPDAQEGLCVNDTCWTREDAYAYAMTYKADPHHDEIMAYIRQLQTAEDPVTFTKDQMATIILPTEPDASKGKYYRLDRCEDNQIIFEQELQPRARVPYIIVPAEDFTIDLNALNLEGLHSDTVSIEGVSFIGSYVREELPALTGEDGVESSYIDFIDTTPDCGPSISAETGKESLLIGTLRAYLIVKWDDPIDHGSPSVPPFGKKEIVLHDYSTGINSLTPDPSPRRGEVFDLQGRRIDNSKLPRGIYIKDKKKVLIK